MAPLPHSNVSHFSLTSLSYCRPPFGAITLHSLFLYSDMPRTYPLSFQLAQTNCKSNLYLYKYPSNFVPGHMKMEKMEMSAHEIQMLWNYPKERIQHYCNLFTEITIFIYLCVCDPVTESDY